MCLSDLPPDVGDLISEIAEFDLEWPEKHNHESLRDLALKWRNVAGEIICKRKKPRHYD